MLTPLRVEAPQVVIPTFNNQASGKRSAVLPKYCSSSQARSVQAQGFFNSDFLLLVIRLSKSASPRIELILLDNNIPVPGLPPGKNITFKPHRLESDSVSEGWRERERRQKNK